MSWKLQRDWSLGRASQQTPQQAQGPGAGNGLAEALQEGTPVAQDRQVGTGLGGVPADLSPLQHSASFTSPAKVTACGEVVTREHSKYMKSKNSFEMLKECKTLQVQSTEEWHKSHSTFFSRLFFPPCITSVVCGRNCV